MDDRWCPLLSIYGLFVYYTLAHTYFSIIIKSNVPGPAPKTPPKLIRRRPLSALIIGRIKDRTVNPRNRPFPTQQPNRLQLMDHNLLRQGVLQPLRRKLQITHKNRREISIRAAWGILHGRVLTFPCVCRWEGMLQVAEQIKLEDPIHHPDTC